MKKITLIPAAFLLLSITFLFANPQVPILMSPPDYATNQPPEGVDLMWIQSDYEPGPFIIELRLDVSESFTAPPLYMGPGMELWNGGNFTFHAAGLLDQQAYYWYVRVTDMRTMLSTDSPVWHFTTGNIVIPSAVLDGTIQNYGGTAFNVSGLTVSCTGHSNTFTNSSGYFSFTVNLGFNYTVTPVPSSWYHFVPTSYTFNNVQSDSTHNFYIVSNKPNLANIVWPVNLMANAPIMLGNLQWSYLQHPGYSQPDVFDVYFGLAGACVAVEQISYSGDGDYVVVIPPPLLPLNYNTAYEWKIVPVNAFGEAEGVETWTFTTAPPPVPELMMPLNNATGVPPEGANLVWMVGEGYQVDSFFDIYVDIDPDFPSPPVFSGTIAPTRYEFQYFTGNLMQEAVYYWKVRCNALGDYWTSTVHNFLTGPTALITYSTISGTVTFGGAAASGVMVTCLTACIPKQVFTGINGNYSFSVTNGNAAAYVITPTKNWWNWFQPVSWSSPIPVTGNIGNVNFAMNSLKANIAVQPLPVQHAEGVTINLPHLQWEFAQQAGYDYPYEFHIYFPDFSSNYVVVPYSGDRSVYQVLTPHAMPLDYNTTYTWKVVPWNPDGGDAENVPIWDFTTVEYNPPPIPQAIYPTDGLGDVCDSGLIMEWGPPPGGGFSPESFFDVYVELDMAEAELIYTGPGLIDPLNPTSRFCYAPDLLLGATYHWWVRVTDQVTGLYSESYHNFFFISPLHLMHASPALIDPAQGETGVPPDNMDFIWWMDDIGSQSFFDIYSGTTPDCSNHMVSGYWNILRTYFEWHCAALMDQQTYCWFVRYSNWVDHWVSNSLVGQFVTGNYTPPPNPQLVSPIDLSQHISTEDIHFVWEEEQGWYDSHPDSFFDVYCDTSPTPTTVIYHGHGSELFSGGYFTFNQAVLLDEDAYHWYVRITDAVSGSSSVSPTWSFITEPQPSNTPGLIEPPDRSSGIPCHNTTMRWSLPDGDWQVDSFFDIYMDTDPGFPNPPVWSGPIPPSRTYFEWHCSALMEEETYYWFCRYSRFVDNVLQHFDSVVHMFTTGPSSVENATISGHVIPGSPLFDASGVTLICSTACIPTTVTTGADGYYCFTIQKGLRHIVTAEEALYRFEPPLGDFDNVQTDIVQDFTKISLLPNAACNPIPVDGDIYVPHDLGRISWQYIPDPGFTPPTEFEVYIPADAPEPIAIVPYNSRALDYFIQIGDIPGESSDAKLKAEGIDVLAWSWGMSNSGSFHTGGGGSDKPKCVQPEYAGKEENGKTVAKVKPSGEARQEFPPDSFFDVFLDTNTVPETNVYHGLGIIDPQDPTGRIFYLPDLLPNTIYHWFVRLTVPSVGDTIDSNNYAFRTAETLITNPVPELVYPTPGSLGITPEGVDLEFAMTPWVVDSLFDIYCDTDPGFPNPPVYSGSLMPSREFFTFHMAALLSQQTYYWYVRYTNFADNWYSNSLIRQFTTGQYVIPSSNISGTISSVHNVSACTVTCPGAVAPASVSTGYYGTFGFTVNNGGSYTVTPTKTGYYFTPVSYLFSNVQANQTANFTMSSLRPNLATNPVPTINATGVPIDIGHLQWEYIALPGYSLPTGFWVYFPADNPTPVYVPYGRVFQFPVQNLAYNSPYGWKVVPTVFDGNEYHDAEGVHIWVFTTEEEPLPPIPLYPDTAVRIRSAPHFIHNRVHQKAPVFSLIEFFSLLIHTCIAQVVELVDTRDLKSLGQFVREGSSPSLGTFTDMPFIGCSVMSILFLC